ncbi:group II intron maturase-specific domain-containing protein, partial [Azotobacter chroococcum]|uniref:group II intron maturase-specific domain-containing protein n=1 Tax=Azotobacter chroococcum TaxID=353 RepID=UPI0024185F7B
RSWNIQRQTPASLLELSQQYNATLRGWWNYYGTFYKTVMRKVCNAGPVRSTNHWQGISAAVLIGSTG